MMQLQARNTATYIRSSKLALRSDWLTSTAIMGYETWATFILAAAMLSAFKRREEIAEAVKQNVQAVKLPSRTEQEALFSAWWPCLLTSVAIMLALTQAHRSGVIRTKFARKAIHISEPLSRLFLCCLWLTSLSKHLRNSKQLQRWNRVSQFGNRETARTCTILRSYIACSDPVGPRYLNHNIVFHLDFT